MIVCALTKAGSTVATLSMPDFVRRSGRYPQEMVELLGARVEVHREISVRIAERYDAVFFDFFNHPVSDDPSVVSADLVHPNMRGYAIIADAAVHGLASLISSGRDA